MMNAEDKYKVVIVDDERTAIDALRRELGAYQEFEIKGTANNGAKGKKMIMELRPDLLFLDVELPDVLGLNLLSEMRDEVLWDMKVVFYTSYDKYLLQALRESAFDFLLKPFETEDLKVVIIKANTDVKIDGKILYVSCDNVTVTGKDSVSIKEGTGIEKTWITEAEEVPSTEAVLETESTEDAGDVIEGEVIIGTEEASGNDVVTNLSGGSSGTDVYTYIIYK